MMLFKKPFKIFKIRFPLCVLLMAMAMAMKILVPPTIVNVNLIVRVVIRPSIVGRMVHALMIVVNVKEKNWDTLIHKEEVALLIVAIAPDGVG